MKRFLHGFQFFFLRFTGLLGLPATRVTLLQLGFESIVLCEKIPRAESVNFRLQLPQGLLLRVNEL